MKSWLTASLLLVVLFLAGCGRPDDPTGTDTAAPDASIATPPADTTRLLPTLYPTASPQPTASPTPPPTRPATAVPDTPVAFDQPVVVLTYRIPALGLDRRLTGNLASQIEAVDETTGQTITRQNQAGILLELQQALLDLELSELPDECDRCVQLSYELPLSEISAEGWLEDAQFLASIENYTAALLGPHYPPGTVAGLRQSATPYYPAHTVALTSDNRLWRWTAVESEVSASETADLLAPTLPALLAQLDVSALREAYQAPCPEGSGIESLVLVNDSGSQAIRLVCPSLSLPASLVPVYLVLQGLAGTAVTGETEDPAADSTPGATPEPSLEPAMPLDSLLLYRRSDGLELNLFLDGRVTLDDGSDQVITSSLNIAQVLTLTTTLAESGLLRPGVESFVASELTNFLVVRGPDGVYEAAWDDAPAAGLEPFIEALEELIDRLLGDEAGLTPTPGPDETPAVNETPAVDETPAADETPPASGTPSSTPAGTAEP